MNIERRNEILSNNIKRLNSTLRRQLILAIDPLYSEDISDLDAFHTEAKQRLETYGELGRKEVANGIRRTADEVGREFTEEDERKPYAETALAAYFLKRGIVGKAFKTLRKFQWFIDVTAAIADQYGQFEEARSRMAAGMAREYRDEIRNARNIQRYSSAETDLLSRSVAQRFASQQITISRTEIANATHEAARAAAQLSSNVQLLRWDLSSDHPAYDICDVYAKHDLQGFGAGLYTVETAPPLPHPNCMCRLVPVQRNERPEPAASRRIEEDELPDDLSDAARKRIVSQANQSSERMARLIS